MLQEKVLNTIIENGLIQKNDKIVIGVSGGPDSMCLLDILYCLKEKLQIELVVSHINHGLRKEAEEETKYVEEYCKKRNIPIFIKRVNVKQLADEQKLGTEEMGRNIRYNFFEEVAKIAKANKIATAHNLNDNAETILMNILRGTAISGLKGIEITRKGSNFTEQNTKNKINQLTYIRPLRECSRAEIEEYCTQTKLNPKIDKTNLENIYTRNKIRNKLIPYLQKEFNPNIIESLNRLSNLAKQNEDYFAEIVKEKYETLKIKETNNEKCKASKIEENTKEKYETSKIGENEKEIILNLKEFNKLPKVIKTRLILYTINKLIGTVQGIQKIHLEDIIKLCQNNIGNKYLTPNKNIKIFIKKGKIFFIAKVDLP